MDRSSALILVLAAFVRFGQAQTLTEATTCPVPGDAFVERSGLGALLGPPGEGVVWDMSALMPMDSYDRVFIDPLGTPFAGLFPSATVVEDDGVGDPVYYASSALGFDLLGGVDHVCTDAIRYYAFPMTFGSTWTDTFDCSEPGSGFYGYLSGEVTGYGDLVLPYGTITDVLRVDYTFHFVTMVGSDSIVNHYGGTMLFKAGVHIPVLSGTSTTDQYTWIDENSIGLGETLRQTIALELSPNPADGNTLLTCTSTGGAMTCSLIDGTGATVREQRLCGPVGILQEPIDLAGLSPGLYTVRLTDRSGAFGSARLIVR